MSVTPSSSFIPTKGSALKANSALNFQCLKFESHKSKKKASEAPKMETASTTKTSDFNIKAAKHEVIKFGMSGFNSRKKEQAKIQLAIKLGAKPPKNKYKNYKVLLQEKAKQKDKEKAMQNFQQLGKNQLGKSIAKGKGFDRKRKKGKGGLLDVYGKVKVPVTSQK